MKSLGTLLIACLSAAPLCGQQVEPKAEAPQTAASGEAPGVANSPAQTASPATAPSSSQPQTRPEQKPVAYLGVFTRAVPAELRSQFSLAQGFGLLVDEVLPDSPAKAAGLKQHDVLVKFEDQQLVNMEQLVALVRAKKKGDVVRLDVITGGKETQLPVTLGEHLTVSHKDPHPFPHHAHHGSAQAEGRHSFHGRPWHGREDSRQGHEHELQEKMERFQREMREYQQRIQEWSKNRGNGAPLPQPPQLHLRDDGHGSQQQHEHEERHHSGHRRPDTGISIPPGTDVQRFHSQSRATSNVTRRDDSGEYTLKTEDGRITFIARPVNGPEQSWPVNTDAERQAMPEQFRDKLRMMDSATRDIRIEIHPAPGRPLRDSSAPENAPPSPPPVKSGTASA